MALIVLCASLSVGLLVYGLCSRPVAQTRRRLQAITGDNAAGNTTARQEDARPPRMAVLQSNLREALPSRLLDKLAKLLTRGNIKKDPEVILAIWASIALGLPALFLFAATHGPHGIGRNEALFGLILFAGGAYIPFVMLRSRVKKRQKTLLRELPDMMDLLTICVEAGLGIDAALGRVAERAKEPLREEVRTVLQNMAMGHTRREALQGLAARTGLQELATFVGAVVQADLMGVSLGTVLRVQAETLRVQRKQRAEQLAFKAPIKIIIVLVLFIFPSMFIVILGPAVLQFMSKGV